LRQAPPLKLFLAEWRERRGLSQDQLAERIGTTKASVSRWEGGKRDVTGEVLSSIAWALNLSPIQLFRHPDELSLDEMLAAAPPTLRRKALALVRTLLEEDDGVLNVDSDATKAKH
jgi:transcriptional regulator with XRE-family HTH domain